MNIPQQITAGDSASWSDEPFVDGHGNTLDSSAYELKYQLRGPAILTLTAVADGTGWKTTLSTTDSATLGAGIYSWAAQLSKTGERVTIGSGSLAVLADLTAATAGYDGRSQAEKALADAEAALADLAGSGKKVKAYKIGTREATYYTAGELIAAISYWRTKVLNERTARDIANGLGNPRNLMVRFK